MPVSGHLKRRRPHAVARLLFVATILSALNSLAASAQTRDWASIEAAAKAEGNVVVYSSATDDAMQNITKLFTQTYGIKVDFLQIRGSEIRERLRTENATGRHIADLIDTNDAIRSMILPGVGDPKANLFAPHPALPNVARLVAPWRDDGTFMPVYVGTIGIIANSRAVAKDRPQVWADLLDAKWKGRIIADDPRGPGAGNALFTVLMDAYGRGFLEKLAAQDLVLSRELVMAARSVAQGEYALYLGAPYRALDRMRGLPIEALTPAEGVAATEGVAVQVTGAPHPNAAALLMNFILSDRAQDLLVNQSGAISVTGRKATSLPPETLHLADGKVLGKPDPADADNAFKVFREVFGRQSAPSAGR